MSSPALLQQLRLLDESSPQFPDRLSSLLDEYTHNERTADLRDEDWSWLVEYLDNVRPRVVFIDLMPKLAQTLRILLPANPAFRGCLRKLGAICGSREVLPHSYILSTAPANTTKWPFASSGSCDIFEGSLDGSKVCVRRLRMYSAGPQDDAKRVSLRYSRLPAPR